MKKIAIIFTLTMMLWFCYPFYLFLICFVRSGGSNVKNGGKTCIAD